MNGWTAWLAATSLWTSTSRNSFEYVQATAPVRLRVAESRPPFARHPDGNKKKFRDTSGILSTVCGLLCLLLEFARRIFNYVRLRLLSLNQQFQSVESRLAVSCSDSTINFLTSVSDPVFFCLFRSSSDYLIDLTVVMYCQRVFFSSFLEAPSSAT